MFAETSDGLQDNAWLYIDELIHRTLNDYTFMLATLDRASRGVGNTIEGGALQVVRQRVRSAAQVYRVLTPPKDDSSCSRLDVDLEDLCKAISVGVLQDLGVILTLYCDPIAMPARECWRVCLIVSELVTNAARHAFAAVEGGAITIEVRFAADKLLCVVSDDGVGPEKVCLGHGSRIVDALVSELGGTVTRIHRPTGSTIVLAISNLTAGERATLLGDER